MKTLTKEEIAEILKKHEMWLNGEEGGERADFSDANIKYADLRDADLRDAYLENANLEGANLSGANLRRANLKRANLVSTDLEGANLEYAYLEYASLEYANLSDKEKHRLGVILKEPMIGYKKCLNNKFTSTVIVTLEIPKGSVVFCINGKKCRTNRAKVVAISEGDIARSSHSGKFLYTIEKEIEIDDFNLMYNVECASGIHFFKTREEAENYVV